MRKPFKLGLSMRYVGYHAAAWRHPDVPADGAVDFNYFLATAKLAEEAKFDMLFFADGLGVRAEDVPKGALSHDMRNVELEPLTLLAALASHTRHIGLVATASTTYNEPFHIARKYASIDNISGGRAGWNVVTSWSQQEAHNFGLSEPLPPPERYERAEEFVEVVKGLWGSWDADALVRDKASGLFFKPGGMHVLDHQGEHFRVKGPLNAMGSPQGRPIIVQAGASEQGRELAARHADVVYSNALDLPSAKAYYDDIKRRAVKHGRRPEDILIMPGVCVYTGATAEEAQASLDRLQALIHPASGLAMLYSFFGDLSGHDLDGPVPPPADGHLVRSIADNLYRMAQDKGMSIRQLYENLAAGFGVRVLVGSPHQVADDLAHWVQAGAADGFNLCPPALPVSLQDFTRHVLPVLRERGLFRHEYTGATLRENLGLRLPVAGA